MTIGPDTVSDLRVKLFEGCLLERLQLLRHEI